jgi:hypothetical protein
MGLETWTVLDAETDAPIAAATITFTPNFSSLPSSQETNEQGKAQFTVVPALPQIATVTKNGYKPYSEIRPFADGFLPIATEKSVKLSKEIQPLSRLSPRRV